MRRVAARAAAVPLGHCALLLLPPAGHSVGRPAAARRWCAANPSREALLPENDDCDDFVAVPGPGGAHHDLTAGTSAVAGAGTAEILGVQRAAADNPELSRLLVPIEADSGPRPLPRGRQPPAVEGDSYFYGDAGGKDGGAPPPPRDLPYDDPKFADAILEMEVQGQLDECWQDSRRSRIEDVKEIVAILRDLGVRDVAVVDTKAKTSSFDYLVFGTCEGQRHIHIASWAVQDADKFTSAVKQPRRKADDMWEAVPIGRIVVNLMLAEYREEVAAERKWAVTASADPLDAARAPVSEGRQVRVHGLWTLTLNLQDLEDFEVDYCKESLMAQL